MNATISILSAHIIRDYKVPTCRFGVPERLKSPKIRSSSSSPASFPKRRSLRLALLASEAMAEGAQSPVDNTQRSACPSTHEPREGLPASDARLGQGPQETARAGADTRKRPPAVSPPQVTFELLSVWRFGPFWSKFDVVRTIVEFSASPHT